MLVNFAKVTLPLVSILEETALRTETFCCSWFIAQGCYRDLPLMCMYLVLIEDRCDCLHSFFFVDNCNSMRVSHGNLPCVSQSLGVLSKAKVLGHPVKLWSCPHLSFPGVAVDHWGWWVLTCAVRLRSEGAGDFPVFAHPGLLIWAPCSMAVAQGTRSAVWNCEG